MGKFYITTPIYYVNASPHIGHAYTQIAVDSLARFHRLIGDKVFFLTGTDEHGEKIAEASEKAGFERGREKEFVDTIVPNFKKTWEELDIKYDFFLRTTSIEHQKSVQEFLETLKKNGDIYKGEYNGWFCVPCETFWSQTQAGEGTCPDCKRKLEKIQEENYFFRMSKYQDWLITYIKENPNFIMPSFRKNEVLGFLREKLNDLCISRPKTRMWWGVELSFDKDYVAYVWLDALVNYISGPRVCGNFEEVWPADFHIIAKDILRHHAVYWPIMLKSAGYSLPKTIFAHGWWKVSKEKMSKSKGNIVDPVELSAKYGKDPLRYFLLKTVGFGLDGDFDEKALVNIYNSDLANDLGNLVNRTLTMVEKYFEGISPEVSDELVDKKQIARSSKIKEGILNLLPDVKNNMLEPALLIKESLEGIMRLVGMANKYVEESAPWEYAKKSDFETIKLIVADLLEVLRKVSVAIYPFMPTTAQEIWKQLGLGGRIEEKIDVEEITSKVETSASVWRRFPVGIKVSKGNPLFPRII